MILQLTRADSWANLSREEGGDSVDTANAPMKHVQTQGLEARDDAHFEVLDQELREGDVILLCSDGLTNMLPDQRILEIISTPDA